MTNFRFLFSLLCIILFLLLSIIYFFIFNTDDIDIQKQQQHIDITLTDNNINNINNNKNTINPLIINKECRNAIINDLNINDIELKKLDDKSSKCKEFNGIYTREGIDAFNQSLCSWKGNLIRSHDILIQNLIDNKGKIINDTKNNNYTINNILNTFPIYYMLPKASSSSIWKILKSTNKFINYGDIRQSQINQNGIITNNNKCSFTFVRSPILRLLSGYYTLNAKLWRSMNSNFDNYYNETFLNEKNNNFPKWNYIKTYGEPQRFNTFIDELISSPKKFTDSMHHNHITSTTEIFQHHLGNSQTSLSFIGKVENFNNDIIKLINSSFCSNYFNPNIDIHVLDKEFISHQMKGFGWGFPKSWQNEYKYHLNWINAMNLMPLYNYWLIHKNIDNILPPAYFVLANNKTLYQRIINYYIQDLICWDYKHYLNFDWFINNIIGTNRPNIYNIT